MASFVRGLSHPLIADMMLSPPFSTGGGGRYGRGVRMNRWTMFWRLVGAYGIRLGGADCCMCGRMIRRRRYALGKRRHMVCVGCSPRYNADIRLGRRKPVYIEEVYAA